LKKIEKFNILILIISRNVIMTKTALERKINNLSKQTNTLMKELYIVKNKMSASARTKPGKRKNRSKIDEWNELAKEISSNWDKKLDAVGEIRNQRTNHEN
jgi:hypothetical protein